MIHVETSDFWWFETRDFELILNILFLGIAEGADLNTYIMKIRVGKNNYKMSILNNISSHVALCPIRLEPLLYLFWQWNSPDMVSAKFYHVSSFCELLG